MRIESLLGRNVYKMRTIKQLTVVLILTMLSAFAFASSVQNYLDDAKKYQQNKNYKAAIIQLKNALQKEPENVNARLQLGKVYFTIGDGPSSYKEYRKARKYGATKKDWLPGLADSMLLQGQASELLNEIKISENDDAFLKSEIYSRFGLAHLFLRDASKAQDNFTKALEHNSQNLTPHLGLARLHYAKKDFANAESRLNSALKIDPENVESRVLKADISRQTNKLSEAKSEYLAILSQHEKYVPAILGLTQTYMILGDTKQARKSVITGLVVNKNIPALNYLHAVLDYQDGDYAKAESSLQKVFNITDKHFLSVFLMGKVQYALGNFEQADQNLDTAYKSNPNSFSLAKVLAATKLKLHKTEKVIEIFEKFKGVVQEDAEALSILGMAYSKKGDYVKGAEYFEKAVELDPKKANIKAQLGMNYLAGGDLDSAITNLQKAIDIDNSLERADVFLVLAHLRKKEFDEALEVSKQFVGKQPRNPVAHNFVGASYIGLGKTEKARKAFNQALDVDPSFVSAEINLAKLDIAGKRRDSAKQRLRRINKKSPNNISAYLLLGRLLLQEGKQEESINIVKTANRQQPKALEPVVVLMRMYLASRQPQKALDVAESVRTEFSTSTTFLDLLARSQLALGKKKDAVVTFEEVVSLVPSNANAHYMLGRAYQNNKNESKAISSFKRSLKIDTKHLQANASLAFLYINRSGYEKAKKIVAHLKKIYPEESVAWVIEGDLRVKQGDYSKSINSYKGALKRNSNNKVLFKLVKSYEETNDIQSAEKALKKWLGENENDAAAHMVIGQLYQKMEDDERSMRHYEKSVRLVPNNLVSLNNLSYVYVRNGDARAIELAKKAYELAPNNPSIIDTYGWALVNLGDKNLGARLLKEASIKAPHLLEIKYHLAYGYHVLGDNQAAKRELNRLLENNEFESRSDAEALLSKLN